jgi:nucleoside-diphosphate-sugar epimerase
MKFEHLTGKHLVVFGCGYVGTAVALEALQRGLRVTALTRNEAKAVVLRDAGIVTIVADLGSAVWHDKIPGPAQFVLNCVSSGGAGIEGYRQSYVRGMASIVSWARRHAPADTFVYTSSTSVYPTGDAARVDESTSTDGAGDRGQLLLDAEALIREANKIDPPCWRRWFILRLAGIYGPTRHHLLSQVRTGEVSGAGAHRLNLIHRDDVVAAIWACFEAPAQVQNEIFNVADDAPSSKQEVVAWLASQIAVPMPQFTGQPAGQRRTVTPDRVIVNTKLKERLRWQPRYPTYQDGYREILETANAAKRVL